MMGKTASLLSKNKEQPHRNATKALKYQRKLRAETSNFLSARGERPIAMAYSSPLLSLHPGSSNSKFSSSHFAKERISFAYKSTKPKSDKGGGSRRRLEGGALKSGKFIVEVQKSSGGNKRHSRTPSENIDIGNEVEGVHAMEKGGQDSRHLEDPFTTYAKGNNAIMNHQSICWNV